MFSLACGATLLTFIFFLISDYFVVLTTPPVALRLLILLAAAAANALIITFGVSVFDPVVLDALLVARRMNRLENLSSPLLLRLSTEAPGTYHHSLNVSDLAHKSAKAIGTDSLLVRTAAYYHDIGKLSNPSLFTENQGKTTEKPESDLQDSVLTDSAHAIISHVAEGIKIARKQHIPEEIIDLIAQHHGTTTAGYFYQRAKNLGIKAKKADFRYPGPNPLSKQAAILMLADSVEASARTLSKHSDEEIRKIVQEVVNEKVSDGQLKKSHLSPSEIEIIQSTLEENLVAIYHQRIEYKKHAKS
ncbi:MAG: HDIG domain-containing metalloprotein [Patescibacteria group bacterium]